MTDEPRPLVCILSAGGEPDLAGAIASARHFALPVLVGQSGDGGKLPPGAATSLTPLAPKEALDSVLENVVSPDFDPMEIVRLVKRRTEAKRLFRLTVAPGATEHALDLLLAEAL